MNSWYSIYLETQQTQYLKQFKPIKSGWNSWSGYSWRYREAAVNSVFRPDINRLRVTELQLTSTKRMDLVRLSILQRWLYKLLHARWLRTSKYVYEDVSVSLPLRGDTGKNVSTRPRKQSLCGVPLPGHKSRAVLHKNPVGGEDGRRGERAPSPSFEPFRREAVGPACFIANASVTSKVT